MEDGDAAEVGPCPKVERSENPFSFSFFLFLPYFFYLPFSYLLSSMPSFYFLVALNAEPAVFRGERSQN